MFPNYNVQPVYWRHKEEFGDDKREISNLIVYFY